MQLVITTVLYLPLLPRLIQVLCNNNALPSSSTDGIRVVGNSNTVNSSNVMVVGNNVKVASGLDGAVVLGNASTVSAGVDTNTATVNGLTYSGFAGNTIADGDGECGLQLRTATNSKCRRRSNYGN